MSFVLVQFCACACACARWYRVADEREDVGFVAAQYDFFTA